MPPKRLRKGLLVERRASTRSANKTCPSNVMIEDMLNTSDEDLALKLRTKKKESGNNSLILSAKRSKKSSRKKRETASAVKQTAQKDAPNESSKAKSRLFKQSLSNEDIADMLNDDTLVTSSASEEECDASISMIDTTSNSFYLKQTAGNSLLQADMVTPRSSPIVVNLSPHRSKKTPKKSPIVSASPKTHSKAALRLSKTPRKLVITVNSPNNSDKSTSLDTSTPHRSEKGISKPIQSLHDSLKMKASLNKDAKKKRSFSTKFTPSLMRFSKSPKIVIRTPKSKSKYKSPKPKLSIGKRSHVKTPSIRISPVKMASLLTSRPSLTPKAVKSSKTEKKSHVSSKVAIQKAAKTFGIKIPNKASAVYVAAILNQPKVMLENVSVPTPGQGVTSVKETVKPKRLLMSTPREKIRRSPHLSSPLSASKTPRATSSPFQSSQSYSKASSSGKHVEDTFSKGTQTLNESQQLSSDSFLMSSKDATSESSLKKSADEINKGNASLRMERDDPANQTYDLLEPKTPELRHKYRKRTSIQADLVSPLDTAKKSCKVRFANTVSNRTSSSPPSPLQLKRSQSSGSISSNKHSRPAAGLLSLLHKSKAREVTKRRQNRSTPSLLRSDCNKRSSSVINFITRKSMLLPDKRSRSLSGSDGELQAKSHQKTSTMTPKSKVGNAELSKQGLGKRASPESPLVSQSKATSVPNGVTSKSPVPDIKRRSIFLSNVTLTPIKSTRSQQDSAVKKLDRPKLPTSSVKKSDMKTPIARKVPNFTHIHQKKFAEMESLVDAKKRIAQRHVALSTMKVQTKPKTDTTVDFKNQTKDSIYNRFGFKLKKNDAMCLMTRNQHVNVRQKTQDKNRAILKGVRINRRFELQMKLRKLNANL